MRRLTEVAGEELLWVQPAASKQNWYLLILHARDSAAAASTAAVVVAHG